MNDRKKLDNNLIESSIILHKTVQMLVQQVAVLESRLVKQNAELLDRIQSLEKTSAVFDFKDMQATKPFTAVTMEDFKRQLDEVAVGKPKFYLRYLSDEGQIVSYSRDYADRKLKPVYGFTREMLIEIDAAYNKSDFTNWSAFLDSYLKSGWDKT